MTISLEVTVIPKTGLQLIIWRALQGAGAAMFLSNNQYKYLDLSCPKGTIQEHRIRQSFVCVTVRAADRRSFSWCPWSIPIDLAIRFLSIFRLPQN